MSRHCADYTTKAGNRARVQLAMPPDQLTDADREAIDAVLDAVVAHLEAGGALADPIELDRAASVPSSRPCRWCGATWSSCSSSPDRGAIKCCPDCDHRPNREESCR